MQRPCSVHFTAFAEESEGSAVDGKQRIFSGE